MILKKKLDKNKTVENYAAELEEIELKISRLGAINLMAMEEYDQELKRKTLLDEQHKEAPFAEEYKSSNSSEKRVLFFKSKRFFSLKLIVLLLRFRKYFFKHI